jgi:hypothetical protein
MFRGVLADMLARLVVVIVDPAISRRKRVLLAVALTKAAMASANVGGTGVGSELLPSHGRSLLHPVHESWKASEATNI